MNLGPEVSTYKDKTIGMYGGKFLPFHNGHLKCIMKAAEQCDVLFVVVSYDDEWDKSLCEGTRFKWVSPKTREKWISEAVKDYPNIRVFRNYEKRCEDYMNDPEVMKANETLREIAGGKIDLCFSSESEYGPYFEKVQPGCKHIVIDEERSEINISATEIREKGVHKMYDFLPQSVQNHYVKRICIVGTESTGKSTVVNILATHYGTEKVPEYGRVFYEKLGGCHDIIEMKDIRRIAIGHNHMIEEKSKNANELLIIDTDNIYTQFFVWEKYKKYDDFIDTLIRENLDEIDLYIYLEPVFDHVLDGMRQVKDEEQIKNDNMKLLEMYEKDYGKKVIVSNANEIGEIIASIDEILI